MSTPFDPDDTATPPARLTGDAGALIIEAALVLPVVLALLMGLIDFSLVMLHQSQLTSAARDGARTGMIRPETETITWDSVDMTLVDGTCPTTSPSVARICAAVSERLVTSKARRIEARCYVGQTATITSCRTDTVRPGRDTLQVTVTSRFTPLTFVGQSFIGTQTYTDSARMVIP
jgi:Flp pilus assembly protein TadG